MKEEIFRTLSLTCRITVTDLRLYFESDKKAIAEIIACKTGAEIAEGTPDINAGVPFLWLKESGLALAGDGQILQGDFTKMISRLKKNNLLGEMVVKAARIKGNDHPYVIDATAGMGEDSLLLAAAGFRVTLYEYNPVIAALLADTIERSAGIEELSEAVSRMTVICGDSIEALRKIKEDERPDVVLLDPMFPERQKKALVKKKFQLLQKLECPCSNEEELLEAAKLACPHKIVIKRPVKGPYLAGVKPSFSMEGKAIRYDCLVY